MGPVRGCPDAGGRFQRDARGRATLVDREACGKDRDNEHLFSGPLKLLGSIGAVSYLVALVAYLAPHRWNLNPQLMFSLCPMYFVKTMFDPSLVAVFFLLAPMNAAVYGSLGLTLGYAWLAFRKRT